MPNSAKNQVPRPTASASKSREAPAEKILELNLQQAVTRSLSEEQDSLTLISKSKWPLIIDKNERAQAFYQHRDVNWLNCMDAASLKPERVRMSLIGAIRFGKAFVLDFMNMDGPLLESFKNTCNMINKDLFGHLTQRTLLDEEKNYMYLAKPDEDGKEYEPIHFSPVFMDKFRVIYCTSNENPSEEMLKISVPVKVV